MSPELQFPGGDGKTHLLGQLHQLSQVSHRATLTLQHRVSCHSLR
jgi:hypothetical protein